MPSIALSLSLRGQLLSATRTFSPISLFSAGEQGIWLDPSDLTTMFQDRAGTTPVTTPGQTVGKRLDKSGRGNHAVAPTDAARPTYGIEPKTGRRNLLTFTEQFDNAAWLKPVGTTTVTPNTATAPDGTMTADLITATAGNACHYIAQNSVTGSVTCTVYAKAGTANWLGLGSGYTNGVETAWFDLATGTRGTVASGGTSTMDPVVGYPGWWRCSHTRASWSAGAALPFVTNANGVAAFNAVGTENLLLWGAQLELGSTATAYQRVGTAFDVTEAGVATVHYVQYDGTDDSFSTSSIDFTATNKMSVFAGVRKLSDAAQGIVAELSAISTTNNGTFNLQAPSDAGFARYRFTSKGTVSSGNFVSGYAAPISNVLTGLGDISGDIATFRINGIQVAQSTTDQGTGNFGNYPLFIGRRNNASLPFNGRDYGIIVVGKTASATEITNTESYLAANTSGVTL